MKSRLLASAALGAALVLGTSGCALVSTQATEIPYSPGDGVNIPHSGPLELRNALIVSEGNGDEGNLIIAIINSTDDSQVLNLEIGEGANAQTSTVRVPARTTLSLGNPEGDDEPLPIDEVPGPAGSTVPVYFQSGDEEGVRFEVPVLDGELDYYNELLP